MSQNFYTLGLPRTRSRWLSFLLESDQADCHHEHLSLTGVDQLPKSKKMYVGSCDTNPFNYLSKRFPLIIIERDKEEVKQSMLNAFDNPFQRDFEPFIDKLIERMDFELKKIDGLRISYSSLDDPETLIFINKFLKPDEETNIDHIAKIHLTNIQLKERNIKPAFDHFAKNYLKVSFENLYKEVLLWQ